MDSSKDTRWHENKHLNAQCGRDTHETKTETNTHRWVQVSKWWHRCCVYLKCPSSCPGGVLLCCTFKCPIERRERGRIKLEEESRISFNGFNITPLPVFHPRLPCPTPSLLVLQTQGYLSCFRHIDFCRSRGGNGEESRECNICRATEWDEQVIPVESWLETSIEGIRLRYQRRTDTGRGARGGGG